MEIHHARRVKSIEQMTIPSPVIHLLIAFAIFQR